MKSQQKTKNKKDEQLHYQLQNRLNILTKKYTKIHAAQKVSVDGIARTSDSLMIQVANVPVDTLKQKLFDIKPIAQVEQNFDALIKSLIYGLLVVLILIGLIYGFYYAKKSRGDRRKKLPPFERAIEDRFS